MSNGKTIISDTVDSDITLGEKRPSLIVLTGYDFGRQYFLDRGETLIGRDENCSIRLHDGRSSRKHAKIVGDPGARSGSYFKIIDLGSTNGTFLNDKRIKEAMLSDGDRVRIGYTVFKYAMRDLVEIEYEKKIYKMATTDALTRLSSREYFFQQYGDTFRRSERYHRPFSIMMIDIDDFKVVNDTHGHPMGDVVLETIGRTILELVRHEDIAARYGGEEFTILLPETSPEAQYLLGLSLADNANREATFSDIKHDFSMNNGNTGRQLQGNLFFGGLADENTTRQPGERSFGVAIEPTVDIAGSEQG